VQRVDLSVRVPDEDRVRRTGKPRRPRQRLDRSGHDATVVSEGKVTVSVTSCTGRAVRAASAACPARSTILHAAQYPAGPGGDINNRRCTNNTGRICTSSANCSQQCVGGSRTTASLHRPRPRVRAASAPRPAPASTTSARSCPLAAGGVVDVRGQSDQRHDHRYRERRERLGGDDRDLEVERLLRSDARRAVSALRRRSARRTTACAAAPAARAIASAKSATSTAPRRTRSGARRASIVRRSPVATSRISRSI
jgi:hypothetical protein